MVTYSIQKEVFINYTLSSVSKYKACATIGDALADFNEICLMPNTFPELYKYKEMKVGEKGTKVTFYFKTPLIIRYKIVRHQL